MARPRRLGTVLLVVLGAAAGLALYRRRLGVRRERVDLYFEDGSMATQTDDADAGRLLPLARDVLRAARA